MSKKELKTNAMRMLERQKIPYEYKTYECEEFVGRFLPPIRPGFRMNWCTRRS